MSQKKFNWNFNNLRLRDSNCKWFSELIEDENSDFSILGIPMDLGVNFRPGTRFAPNSIREELAKNSCFLMDKRKDFSNLKIRDCGDILYWYFYFVLNQLYLIVYKVALKKTTI